MEHWSSPNGCHEDCPACASETKKLVQVYIEKQKGWVTLHLWMPEAKGYSAMGGFSKDDLILRLLQWPIIRNADYKFVTKKQMQKQGVI